MYNCGLTREFKQIMEKELYVVYFESANYACAGEYVLVWATDEEDAMSNDALIEYAEDYYRCQDEAQYMDENDDEEPDGVVWASIQSAELLIGSDHEEFALNPKPGCSVYHYMNTKD